MALQTSMSIDELRARNEATKAAAAQKAPTPQKPPTTAPKKG
jgi:hypothetical protein